MNSGNKEFFVPNNGKCEYIFYKLSILNTNNNLYIQYLLYIGKRLPFD